MNEFFEILLVTCLIASLLIALCDQLFFYKARRASLTHAHPNFNTLPKKTQQALLKAPFLADYARSLLPVFILVFVLRTFIFGLYVVPTGSMLPTIQLDDVLYVNKLAYEIHLPFKQDPLWIRHTPQTGDIAVFHFPVNPNVDYIKTIIGVPGDQISYIDKKLYLNGHLVPQTYLTTQIEPTNANLNNTAVELYQENLNTHLHWIYNTPNYPSPDFYHLVVPKGEYFVMGDNRDNSDDSRYWGFVPQSALVGRAVFILASFNPNHFYLPRWDRFFKSLP